MYVPFLFIFLCYVHVVSSQVELKNAIHQPLQSEAFIIGISNALADPWNHTTALTLYFQKLTSDHANNYIWASSDALSQEYWTIFQCEAALATRIQVSNANHQTQQLQAYQKKYDALYPK